MSTTSIAMHPASANASSCTGDGPAALSPSTTVAFVPLVAPKRSASAQISSATTGGLASAIASTDCTRDVSARCGLLYGLSRSGFAAAKERREREPPHWERHEQIRQILAVPAVGPVWFGCPVQRLAVRE